MLSKADQDGEWDEGYSATIAADGKHVLLQCADRRGDVARISLTQEQLWEMVMLFCDLGQELDANRQSTPQ